MNLCERIATFIQLGEILRTYIKHSISDKSKKELLDNAVAQASQANDWFTPQSIQQAIEAIANQMLIPYKLEHWTANYPTLPTNNNSNIKVGIVMAGNLPLVGFHDLLCVLICGYKACIKTSSKDSILPQTICSIICQIEPRFTQLIQFTDKQPTQLQAALATGSNNSARYFKSWYNNIPHIIRHNRTSIAILTGNETNDELNALGKDIFMYYGLGCRNISALLVPNGYNFNQLQTALLPYSEVMQLKNYNDCYRYQKAVMQLSDVDFIDNGFLLLRNKSSLHTPISVVNYQFYDNLDSVALFLAQQAESIQCIVAQNKLFNNSIGFGNTQSPELNDYADNIDTLLFLSEIEQKQAFK